MFSPFSWCSDEAGTLANKLETIPFWTRDADRLLASLAPLEQNTICDTEVQVIGTLAFLLPPLVGSEI